MKFVRGAMAAKEPAKYFSLKVRQQMAYIVSDAFGEYYEGEIGPGNSAPETTILWVNFYGQLVRMLGVPSLTERGGDKQRQIIEFLQGTDDQTFLTTLGLLVRYLRTGVEAFERRYYTAWDQHDIIDVESVYHKINGYLAAEQLPFRVIDGTLQRRDRELPAKQIELPALRMLQGDVRFEQAAKELQAAIDALDNPSGNVGAIRSASHALESTLHIAETLLGFAPSSRQLSVLLSVARAKGLLGSRESKGLEVLVGGARNVEPGEGHGAGAEAPSDPTLPEFVVDVACAAIKMIYDNMRSIIRCAPIMREIRTDPPPPTKMPR